jgi:hypothetical protein
MNRLLLAWGATITLIGLGVYLSQYYALLRCNYEFWGCPWTPGLQEGLRPGILLLVPLGLAVVGYSFRRQGGARAWNPWPVGRRGATSAALFSMAVVIAVVGSIYAITSLPVAFGATESKCAIELPSGSTVNPSAGRIVLSNGSAVAISHFPCSMTSVTWGAAGIVVSEQYLPLALAVVAIAVLLYLAVRTRPMREAGNSPAPAL